MENNKEQVINEFIIFLTSEFKNDENLSLIQFGKWSLSNFKVDLEINYKNKNHHLFVDIRELDENRKRFFHLKGNILDQINKIT